MNSQLYIEECLQKRILPMIQSHQAPVKFWPDFASSKATLKWYEDNEIDFKAKDMNPPDCPEFRPIEEFWGIVKGNRSKNGGSATDVNSMRQKWNKFAQKVTPELVQKMMGGINRKIREFVRSSKDVI